MPHLREERRRAPNAHIRWQKSVLPLASVDLASRTFNLCIAAIVVLA